MKITSSSGIYKIIYHNGKKSPYSELFWSAFFPHFPTFGLNKERYGVMVVIYCYLERENYNVLRFHVDNYTYFEMSASLY